MNKKNIFKKLLLLLSFSIPFTEAMANTNMLYIYSNLETPELAEESISLLQCLSNSGSLQWEITTDKSSIHMPRIELEELSPDSIEINIKKNKSEEKIKLRKEELSKNVCEKILKDKDFIADAKIPVNTGSKESLELDNKKTNYTPWIIGASAAIALALGYFLLSQKNNSAVTIRQE